MAWARKISAVLTWKVRRRTVLGPYPTRAARELKTRPWLVIFLTAAVLAASGASARAGCNEDCKSEYVSALGDCRSQYEKGNENLQDLEDCLVDTRSEYDDCIDDCTSLGAGGVVACKSTVGAVMQVLFLQPASR
ncbi:MAG TPA: hypothetical protein VKB84_20100 [Candidatus Binataceae bacterium]|nr:hypothetical protein [Candidatus Binataceae bacterium]